MQHVLKRSCLEVCKVSYFMRLHGVELATAGFRRVGGRHVEQPTRAFNQDGLPFRTRQEVSLLSSSPAVLPFSDNLWPKALLPSLSPRFALDQFGGRLTGDTASNYLVE